MPTYAFKDTTTGEMFEKVMKIAEREQYLQENPNLQQMVTAPVLIDPVRLGVRKVDSGFKEVLQKIHTTAGSKLQL
jgi:hypothetical protein